MWTFPQPGLSSLVSVTLCAGSYCYGKVGLWRCTSNASPNSCGRKWSASGPTRQPRDGEESHTGCGCVLSDFVSVYVLAKTQAQCLVAGSYCFSRCMLGFCMPFVINLVLDERVPASTNTQFMVMAQDTDTANTAGRAVWALSLNDKTRQTCYSQLCMRTEKIQAF